MQEEAAKPETLLHVILGYLRMKKKKSDIKEIHDRRKTSDTSDFSDGWAQMSDGKFYRFI